MEKTVDNSVCYFRIPLEKLCKEVDQLQDSLAQMHKRVALLSEDHRRKKGIQSRQLRREPNFEVGDYVLVGDPDPGRRAGRKLHLLWKGQFKITDTLNGYIFELENIINRERRVVHGDRIRYYTDKQLNVTERIKDQFAYDSESYEVQQFRGCRLNRETHQLEFLVDWKGFSQAESTWELVQSLYNDVPKLVQIYHETVKQTSHELANMVQEEIMKWNLH